MANAYGLLSLTAPVGKGQANRPDDVEKFDDAMRAAGAYMPPPEYADGPQRYATEPLLDALELLQEKSGLKRDGIANPGGPTERTVNNLLLNKPRGAGLLHEPAPPIADTVGNGFKNDPRDVASVKRRLGALGYMPEDPFDDPPGFIDELTTRGIKRFQDDNGLTPDGWMAPSGETERTLGESVARLERSRSAAWRAFAERTRHSDPNAGVDLLNNSASISETHREPSGQEEGIVLVRGGGFGVPSTPISSRLAPNLNRRDINPRSLFGVNPNYIPRPDFRRPVERPRDLEWANPRSPRSGQAPPDPPWTPVPTQLGPLSVDDLDRAVRRGPLPDFDKTTRYTPEPGSALGIPLIALHRGGRPGDPRTRVTNEMMGKAIEDACKEVMKNAKIEYYAGPNSTSGGEKAVKGPEGTSFPDFETQIVYEGVTIRIFGDTYTQKGPDWLPNAREAQHFARLHKNAAEYNSIYVRLPKPWRVSADIDLDKLAEFTKELCKEVKKAVDEKRIGDGKDKLQLEKFFKHLVKRKPPREKTPGDPAAPADRP